MRHLFVISILLMSFGIMAQGLKENDSGDFIYQKIQQSQLSSDDIYLKLRQWFVETYKSSEAVLEIEDGENGVLMGKGTSNINIVDRFGGNTTKDIDYTLKIEIKEARFRITFSDIYYVDAPYSGNNYQRIITPAETLIKNEHLFKRNGKLRKFNASLKSGAEEQFDALTKKMKDYLQNSVSSDDW